MANDIQTFNGALPAPSPRAQAKARELAQRFTTGIAVSFPRISIEGKTFTLKHNGQTMPILANGMAAPIEVVMVNASPYTNKSFYLTGYDGQSKDAPDCWSNDGIYPDASIPAPLKQNPTCNGCRWNKFGTAPSQDGKGGKGKACADSRRIVLAFPQDLIANQLGPIMIRVPVTSLPNLANYVNYIAKAGFPPNGVVTRLTFAAGPYPKLEFGFVRPLSDDELDLAFALEEDERTTRIIAAPPEGDAPSVDNPNKAPRYETDTAPPPAPPAAPPPPPAHSAPQPENHPVLDQGIAGNFAPVTPGATQPAQASFLDQVAPGFLSGLSEAIENAKPVEAAPPPPPPSPPTQHAAPPAPTGERPSHIIDLPNGQYYDPIGRFYCDAQGNRLDAAPAQQTAPAQSGWKPPTDAPAFQPQAAAAPPPKRARRSAAEKAAEPPAEAPKADEPAAAPAQAAPAPKDLEDVLAGFTLPPQTH